MTTTTIYGFQLVDGPEHLNNVVHFADEQNATLTALSGGGWFAAWDQFTGGVGDVYGEIRENDGTVRAEPPTQLSQSTTLNQYDVQAAGLTNGNVIVAWSQDIEFHSHSQGSYVRLFSSSGVAISSDFLLRDPQEPVFDTVWFPQASQPTVCALPGGGFVVAWRDVFLEQKPIDFINDTIPLDYMIKAAIYDAVGNPIKYFNTDVQKVTLGQLGSQPTTNFGFIEPSVMALASGNIVIAMASAAKHEVSFQIYDVNNDHLLPRVIVDDVGTINHAPHVVGLSDGTFVIAYRDMDSGNTDTNITLSRYSSLGVFLNSTVANAGFTAGLQADPVIKVLSNGFLAVGWTIDGNAAPTSRVDNIAIFTPDTLQKVLDFQQIQGGFNLGDKPALAALANGRLAAASNDYFADADGTDIFTTTVDITRTITSDGAPDALVGDDLRDTLLGNGGTDTLIGKGGNDLLDGGTGGDLMYGGLGDDIYEVDNLGDTVTEDLNEGIDRYDSYISITVLPYNVENVVLYGTLNLNATCNDLPNVVNGNPGDNVLRGLGGDDYLLGYNASDSLYGGENNDTLDGGSEGDYLSGENGADTLYGGSGADTLDGGDGIDYLGGGQGVDSLYAGAGDDVMQGGDDGDYLDGGLGADTMYGEAGDDVMVAGNDASADYMDGGDGSDTLYGRDGNDTMLGGLQADALYGENGGDYLFGGDGNDYLNGGAGGDYMLGEAGADTLDGGATADYMDGGFGQNSLYGSDGGDVIHGGADADYLGGQNGSDTLYGEGGSDVLDGGSDSSNDYLDGGALGDAYIFGAGMGHDVIGTFDDGGGAGFEDYIYIDHNIVANFAMLSPAMAQNGANVIVNLGGFGAIQINNVSLGNLGADDFIFY